MTARSLLSIIVLVALLSCSKEQEGISEIYYVNAGKMIGLPGTNWNNIELQLRNKSSYRYIADPPYSQLKAKVTIKAVDDSNRAVKGAFYLNISPDNRVEFAGFSTEPVTQAIAYAMVLNYNNASLQAMIGNNLSIGEVQENGISSSPPVSVVLSKLINGQTAERLGIIYGCAQGHFSFSAYKRSDGRFIFGYVGQP